MVRKQWVAAALMLLSLLTAIPAQSKEITINKIVGEKEQLIADILTLVISKADPEASIKQLTSELPNSRLMSEVHSGTIDLMWAGVEPTLESELLPIRIPILKGLLGHRIFIIKKSQQARFNNIQTVEDLKQFKAGQGTTWGDTQILKNANIPVVTTIKYPNLFPMLEGERFDYFPRAIHEPWSEVAAHPELNLAVEKNIMLVYPFAMYFFVKKNDQALHDKLYRGFEMAIADGSFNQLFFNDPIIKDALTKTDLKHRTVIKIKNPAMHPDTPVDRKEFWLDPTRL